MTWQPKYDITNKILSNIKQIGEVVGEFRGNNLSNSSLVKLQYDARILSSFASTSIEGNPLPLTDVKNIIKNTPAHIRDAEKEVLNYNQALEYIHQKTKSNSLNLSDKEICAIHKIVTNDLMDNIDIGQYRKRPVIIRDPRNVDDIEFIPPDYKDVQKLMDQLISFVNNNINIIDPIIIAALFHKQFVIIHPFMDGNGRTTRLVTSYILSGHGLDLFEIFSFEHYYNQNVTKYFNMVGEFGDYYDIQDKINFTEWIEYFTDGLLDELKRVQKSLPQYQHNVRIEAHHRVILEYIQKHGSITQREYGNITERSLAARKQDFLKLLKLGLIESNGDGRATYYTNVSRETY